MESIVEQVEQIDKMQKECRWRIALGTDPESSEPLSDRDQRLSTALKRQDVLSWAADNDIKAIRAD